jgi:hypothetical protein
VTSEKSGTNSGDFATGVNDTGGTEFSKKKSDGLYGTRGGPGEDNKYLTLVMEKDALH